MSLCRPTSGKISYNDIVLVGDVLMSVDPLRGVGCGFAFQTAKWLVDTLAPCIQQERSTAPALQNYTKRVSRELKGRRFFILDYAWRHGFNAIERLNFSAAAKDTASSRHLHTFGSRLIGSAKFFAPSSLLRAAWVDLRRPAAPSAQPNAPV